MKRFFLVCVLLIISIPILFAQPAKFFFTPNNASGGVIATVEINGIPASSNDWIAAFDEDYNCAGAVRLLEYGGQTYCNLQVYGNDFTTDEIDEGMDVGETFTFRLWEAATGEIFDHPIDMDPIAGGWLPGLNGSPIPGYSFEDEVILNFLSPELICTQTINLNPGWNLISLDVSLADNNITSLFNGLITNTNSEYVVGFNNGAKVYSTILAPILWPLKSIEDGFGYWIRVNNTDVFTIEGTCLDDDFRIPLNFEIGWNLIAYPPDEPQAPATYFVDLIAAGNLEFVAGFDDAIKIFDPNQPAFLNTLLQLENGRGYWVKVSNATN